MKNVTDLARFISNDLAGEAGSNRKENLEK
jgi:hypothetical protein